MVRKIVQQHFKDDGMQVNRDQEIEKIKMIIFGDGNGNKGLIRRVDGIDHGFSFVKKQNWAILLMLLGLFIERILF